MLQIYADTFNIATRMDAVIFRVVPTFAPVIKFRRFRLRHRLGKLVGKVRDQEAGL